MGVWLQHLSAESQLKDHRASYGHLDFSREPLSFLRWRTIPVGLCFWGSLCISIDLEETLRPSGQEGAEGGSMRETDP